MIEFAIADAATSLAPTMAAAETSASWWLVGLAIIGMIANAILVAAITGWRARGIRDSIATEIRIQLNEVIQAKVQEEARVAERALSANITGVMDKVREIEIFIRDEFVRKESFNMVVNQILAKVDGNASSREAWQIRMEKKIDDAVKELGRAHDLHSSRGHDHG